MSHLDFFLSVTLHTIWSIACDAESVQSQLLKADFSPSLPTSKFGESTTFFPFYWSHDRGLQCFPCSTPIFSLLPAVGGEERPTFPFFFSFSSSLGRNEGEWSRGILVTVPLDFLPSQCLQRSGGHGAGVAWRPFRLAGTSAFLGGTVEACFQCQPWMQYEHDILRRGNPLTARNDPTPAADSCFDSRCWFAS